MAVKIVLGNIYSKIVGHLPEEVQTELDDTLSYKHPNARFIPRVQKKLWDGVFRLYYRGKGQQFYTGLLAFVRDVLNEHKIPFTIHDGRVNPGKNYPELIFTPPSGYEERDYQAFTIDRSEQFTRGVQCLATGGGKTMIVTKLIGQLQTYPFIFFVLTKDLMDQAHDTLSSCLNVPIGRIGDGKADFQKITVCTIQTAIRALNAQNGKFKLKDYKFDEEDKWDEKGIENEEKAAKIRKLIGMCKGVYFDEVHHAAAQTAKEVLTAAINAYWRFGGSATPYRESGDEIMIQAMFGSKIVDINASYLIKEGHLIHPYIFFDPIDSEADYHSYAKIYKNCICENEPFNSHVADTANHLVSKDLSTLILVQHYKQGDMLKAMIPGSEFVTGKMSSKKRRESIQALRDRKSLCMIATSLADEGLDIPTLDAALLAGGGASATRINQRIGRTLRQDKKDPKEDSIVVVYDHYRTRFLKDHTKKVKRILKKEKEFTLLESKGADFLNNEIDDVLGIPYDSTDIFDL
jgi:superfamily II DNA or RNA helicase